MTAQPEPRTIKVLQYNVGTSRSHMAELLRDERAWDYDIIALQEPYLNKFTNPFSTHNPIKDRFYEHVFHHKMTRVATFINKSIPAEDIEITGCGPNLTEVVIKNQGQDHKQQLVIYNIYNPNPQPPLIPVSGLPTRSPLPQLNRKLQDRRNSSIIVVGDFNLKDEKWGGPGATEIQCPRGSGYLLQLMEKHGLEVCFEPGTITRPARGDTRESTIDITLATEDIQELLISSGIEHTMDVGSDHLPIATEFNFQLRARHEDEERYLLKRMDTEAFIETLRLHVPEIPETGLNEQTIDEKVEAIRQALATALQESTPKARLTPRSKAGFTPECTAAIKKFKQCRRRWRRRDTIENFVAYQLARREKKEMIKRTLRDEHRNRLGEIDDMSSMWKVAKWAKNRGTPRVSFTPEIKNQQGTPQKTTQGKAEALKNSFFPRPPEADTSDIGGEYPTPWQAPRLTEKETMEAIKRASPNKAPGPDQIPNKVLQAGITQLTTPLTNLYNNCLQAGYYPKAWRSSTTVALRKPNKGDYTKPKSYRPVALLNTMGKILDSILARRLAHMAESCGLLPNTHMGGRAASSCEHAIHLMLERIYWARRHNLVVTLLLMDVSGAFDNVNWDRLIHNLKQKRIPTEWVSIIRSFLQGRETRIRLPEGSSEPFNTPTGIPQGSPLSPILYLFYNAMLLEIEQDHGETIGYIDDIGIITYGESTEDTNNQIDQIHQKMEQWALGAASVFAPDKYHVIHFCPNNTSEEDSDRPLILHLLNGNTQTIVPSTEERYLGVILDSKLNGEAHLRHVEDRASTQLQAIAQLAGSTWGISVEQMRQLYLATVVPRITYAASCWYIPEGGHGFGQQRKQAIRVINNIQKKATCYITGAFRTTAAAALEAELYIPPAHITLRRACEAGAHRIISSPHYNRIKVIRMGTYHGNKPNTHYKYLSPLQKLEASIEARYPDRPKHERIRPGLFNPWDQPIHTVIPPTEAAKHAHDRALQEAMDAPNHMCIYTDGSDISGEVGAAAFNAKNGTNDSRYIGPSTTANNYAAELIALILAMDMVLKEASLVDERRRPPKATIFSDSQAAIRAVENPGNKSGQALVFAIWMKAKIAKRKGTYTTIQWVKAHVGTPGNEKVDRLAKQATGWTKKPLPPQLRPKKATIWERPMLLVSAANTEEKKLAKRAWQKTWNKGKTGERIRKLLPGIGKQSLGIYKSRSKAINAAIIQMRTGKIALKAYLHHIKRAPDRNCSCGEPQTVQHILLLCSNHNNLREQVWGRNLPTCHTSVLIKDAYRAAKFITKTGLLGQFTRASEQIQ